MNILAGLTGVGALVEGASNLVSAWRSSGQDPDQFRTVLRQELATALSTPDADATARINARTDALADNVLLRLDADGDGNLSRGESALRDAAFDRIDTNTDGLLSRDEIRTEIAALQTSIRSSSAIIVQPPTTLTTTGTLDTSA